MDKQINDKFRKVFLALFPSARAFLNFIGIWMFCGVCFLPNNLLIVLISALGTFYCYNEWAHIVEKGANSNGC